MNSSENQIENSAILTGRVYPAISNCVNNRYKIIAGYIAIVGFILVGEGVQDAIGKSGLLWLLPLAFTIFIVLNSCNYYYNTKDQLNLEGKSETPTLLEIWLDFVFSIVMVGLVWLLYCFIGLIQCQS